MRLHALLPIVAAALLVAPPAASASPDAASTLAGLQRWLDGTRDLQGRFEQALVSGALGAGPRESGRLYLSRPGRMRWEYTAPERKIALLDGDATQLYLAAERQLHRARLRPDEAPLAALLAGSEPLATVFEAAALPAAGGRLRLRLTPRRETAGVEEIVLSLEPATFAVASAEVLDAAGNRMTYAFSDLRRNRGVADALFRFTPPRGTEIIEGA
jgi:outer membrane lipoprotein carrier protein